MELFHSPQYYLYNLQTTSSSEAKRIWRNQIREKWNNQCAYCGSEEKLTLDHIIPQSKGGMDFTKNVVCCCHSCNQNKGHSQWEEWYSSQDFFSNERYEKIKKWMKPDSPQNLFRYKSRSNQIK
jgi:CRISPR/Cas system Type II protein with McrA/HNH and RuvC-like nuclease domain